MLASGPPIRFGPQTLLVTPPGTAYSICADHCSDRLIAIDLNLEQPALRRWVAGEAEPALILVCGHFLATRPGDTELFQPLEAPVVQSPCQATIGDLMKLVQGELATAQAGGRTMAAAMLAQILVMMFRHALAERQGWIASIDFVRDTQVVRAFRAMVQQPGAPHTIASLAQLACLSRSAFAKRFHAAFGYPPATLLRELRLLRAADFLRTGAMSVEQVARAVGYASASSFTRAFALRFGCEPSAYRYPG